MTLQLFATTIPTMSQNTEKFETSGISPKKKASMAELVANDNPINSIYV
jgi:hypothetical protein